MSTLSPNKRRMDVELPEPMNDVSSPRSRRQRPLTRPSEQSSSAATVSFIVKVKSLTAGTWAVTSVVDLGSSARDDARLHETTTAVSWTDLEQWAAQAGYVMPPAYHLVPLGMRGTQVRKVLNALCDSVGVPVVLRFLSADACLTSGSARSVRVFSRQMSSGTLQQLGVM